MNKIKVLSLVALGLLISNLLLVGFIFFRKPPMHEGPRKIIAERLHFDENQIKTYDGYIQNHRKAITQTEEQIRNLKNQLYGTLHSEGTGTQKDSLIKALGGAQMQIEQIHYKHFEEIKSLCNDNQKKDFDNLTQDIARLFAPNNKKPR